MKQKKAQIVERFSKTLKAKMWKYFTKQGGPKRWVQVWPDLVYNDNTSKHRSIGMTPSEASLKKDESEVYTKSFPPEKTEQKSKFEVGDHRISVKRGDFRKGYRPNFTKEIFIISQVLDTTPFTYRIKDRDGEEIFGSFYNEELVKIIPNG